MGLTKTQKSDIILYQDKKRSKTQKREKEETMYDAEQLERAKRQLVVDERRLNEFMALVPLDVFVDVAREEDQISCNMVAEAREELIRTTGNPPHPEWINTPLRQPRTPDQIEEDAKGLLMNIVYAWVEVLCKLCEIAEATRYVRKNIGSVALDDNLLPIVPLQRSGMEKFKSQMKGSDIGDPELGRMLTVVANTAKSQIDKFRNLRLPQNLVIRKDEEGYYIV